MEKYFVGLYEKEIEGNVIRHINYINAGDGMTAIVLVEEENGNTETNTFFTYKDHLGSIVVLTDENGDVVMEQSFDSWGRRRNPSNWTFNNISEPPTWLRGYTNHEHLPHFDLVNMNGRIYDPILGRMLSPDNYVQDPLFSQSYNRYSYVWNNPLKYTDPSGDFAVVDSWLIGFVDGFFSEGSNRFSNAWSEANLRAGNDAKIWGGLFVSDPNKNFWGRSWEIISRLTWQSIQTAGGFLTSQTYNTFGLAGGVESVDYAYGATVLRTRNGGWGAVTQGSYIVGDNEIKADANNWLFQHEYGHYLQSQGMGIAYYGRVGIPSLLSKEGEHTFHPVELDANRRGFLYFNENVDGFYKNESNAYDDYGWNFERNPLVSKEVYYGGGNIFIDYKNNSDILSLDKIQVKSKWYDYALPILSGFINAYTYNNP
jgi:RHS repeat-associated protein